MTGISQLWSVPKVVTIPPLPVSFFCCRSWRAVSAFEGESHRAPHHDKVITVGVPTLMHLYTGNEAQAGGIWSDDGPGVKFKAGSEDKDDHF